MARPSRLSLQPLRRGREASVDVAYDYLKEPIFSGPLKPGDRVSVEQAIERLGVSRQPVRDAINRLAYEGSVVVIPQVGQFVATLSPEEELDFEEVFSWFASRMTVCHGAEHRGGVQRIEGGSDVISQLWNWRQPLSPSALARRFRELDRQFHSVVDRMAKALNNRAGPRRAHGAIQFLHGEHARRRAVCDASGRVAQGTQARRERDSRALT